MLTKTISTKSLAAQFRSTGFAHRHPLLTDAVLLGHIPYFERAADGTETAIKVAPAEPSSALSGHRDDGDGDASADIAKAACEAAGGSLPSLHHRSGAESTRVSAGGGASADIAAFATRAATSGALEPDTSSDASASIAAAASAAAGG